MTLLTAAAGAADGPQAGGNAERSAVAAQRWSLPLNPAWTYQAAQPPSPAFQNTVFRSPMRDPPVGNQAWARLRQNGRQGLAEPVTYDYVFHPVVAGTRVLSLHNEGPQMGFVVKPWVKSRPSRVRASSCGV
jgi:hypothetical protein